MAARGARAAGGARAAHRRTPARSRGRCGISGARRGVPAGPAAIGLDHRPQLADRHPLGHGQCRRHSPARGGIGRARAGRHAGAWRFDRGAMQQATRTVPIVFPVFVDPVGAGVVESLARPGGNATGFMSYEYSLSGKWLELLKQIAPNVTRAAVLRNPAYRLGPRPVRRRPGRSPVARGGGEPGLRARRRRDRARCRGLCWRSEWRPDRAGERAGEQPSRADRHARGPAQAAHGLLRTLLRHLRRPDFVRARFCRPVPASRRLRRSHPQGREAGRPAGAGADQVRTGDQPQDREGARPRPCRRRCSPAPTR